MYSNLTNGVWCIGKDAFILYRAGFCFVPISVSHGFVYHFGMYGAVLTGLYGYFLLYKHDTKVKE